MIVLLLGENSIEKIEYFADLWCLLLIRKKNISEQKYSDSLLWREKKEQNFEPMMSVLKTKSSQETNVSCELKKSQSFHWSGHAPIFCSVLLYPRFYFVPVEVPSGFAVLVEENLPLEGLFSFGVSTLVSLDDSQHLPQLNFTDSDL